MKTEKKKLRARQAHLCYCWPINKGKRELARGLEAELGLALPASTGKKREGKERGASAGLGTMMDRVGLIDAAGPTAREGI